MAIWKKLTSVFMSVALVVGLCPSMAFAQGGVQAAGVNLTVQDGAGFAEVDTGVERTLVVNPEAKTIATAGAELTSQPAKSYDGDIVQFVKEDLKSEFKMFSNPSGDMIIKRYGGKVHISFTPSSRSVYDGFYINATIDGFPEGDAYPVEGYSDSDWIAAKGTDGSFTYDFALPESYCGYAWPVVPVKTADRGGGTTGAQYYLTIPALDKIEAWPADGLYSLPNMSAGPGDMFNHMIPGSRYLKVDGDTATIMFVQDASTKSVAKYSRIALGKSSELVETAYQPTLPEGTTIVEGVDAGTGANGTKWGFEIPVDKEQAASLLDRDPDSEDAKLYITIWNNQGASSNGNVPGWYKASSDNYITLGALGEKVSQDPVTYDLAPANTEKMFVVVKVVLEDYPGTHDYLTYYLNSGSYGYAFSGIQDDAVASWDFDAKAPKADDVRWAAKASEEIDYAYTTWDGKAQSGKASKLGYRIPVTVPEGETQFSLPVVAYASDFTARSFQVDLGAKAVVPGSASDVASLDVSSSVADVTVSDKGSVSYTGYVRPYAGNQNASSNPLSNDFVGKLSLNLGTGSVYDQAYAVTYQGKPYVKVETAKKSEPIDSDYATVGADGTLELPFSNEYDTDPQTVQLNGNKITVMMHVADSALYVEAGTWVERTFQLDFTSRTAGMLAISGAPLTERIDFSKAVVTLSADSFTYNGADQRPTVAKVEIGGVELAADAYEVSYPEEGKSVDAGDYSVEVTPKDLVSYARTATAAYKIAPLVIEVPSAERNLVYTGGKLTGVKAGTGYTVTGNTGTDAKTYTATVTAAKNYELAGGKSSATVKWTIAPASIESKAVTLSWTSKTFNASVQKPSVSKVNGKSLKLDTDYTATYSNANSKNAGSYTVTVTGKGNYTGKAKAATYTIAPISIANKTVTLAWTSKTFNSKVQKPAVSKVNSKSLKLDTDYTAKYSNASSKNAGSYTVTVTGKGNYTGKAKAATYKIAKATNTVKVTAKKQSVKFANAKKSNQTIKAASAFTVKSAQGAVSYAKNKADKNKTITVSSKGVVTVKKGTKKGAYNVKVDVTAAGNTNYNKATKTVTLQVVVK